MPLLRVLPAPTRLPLFGTASTRAIEQAATAQLPAHALMSRAGRAVARLALALAPHARTVWICAGPGNNGGDGIEAAMHLQAAGKDVRVRLHGDPGRLPADARDAFERAQAAGIAFDDAVPALAPNDLAIDALLGIGASRAPDGAMAAAIEVLNALPCPVLAVDLPSGLGADTGRPHGPACVRAQHTLSLLGLKPGLFTGDGRDLAGVAWLDDLGVAPQQAPDAWLAGGDAMRAPPRGHGQHKGSFGDVAVVGGAPGMAGAAVLAARAAHAAGAGRVYLSLLDGVAASHDPLRPELMWRAAWWTGDDAVLAAATVVAGCGGGDAVRAVLPRLMGAAGRLVLDADALNAIATDSALQTLLRARASRGRPTVLTPHPLEAARLLATTTAAVQADRLAAARALADGFRCVVLLKGSGTVVAAPGSVPCINATGNAKLATAGTGDVLAGWIGGTWAQRAAGEAFEAAVAAAAVHGAVADRATTQVLRAGDLVEQMAAGNDRR